MGNPESYMPMKLLEGISGKLKNSGADILLKDSGIKGNIHVFAEEVQEHPFISGIIVQGDILLETPDVKKKAGKALSLSYY
jgi:hypothetical protein